MTDLTDKSVFSIKKIILSFLAVAALFGASVLLINLAIFDQQLRPEVVDILKPVKMPSPQKNAYFAFWGLSAADDRDMQEAGIQIVERYRYNYLNNGVHEISDSDYTEILGGVDLDKKWTENYPSCTSRTTLGCLSKLSQQLIENPLTHNRISLLLGRFERLKNLPDYQHIDHVNFETPLPPFGKPILLSRLNLATAFNSSDEPDFINALQSDLEFWRKFLSKGDTLLDQMIAVAAIWTDLQSLSEVIASRELSPQAAEAINAMLTPITPGDANLRGAFEFEFRAFERTMATITPEQLELYFGVNAKTIFLLMQPNATTNSYYQYVTLPFSRLSELSTDDFLREFRKFKGATETGTSDAISSFDSSATVDSLIGFSPASLYNLGGKIMLPAATGSYEDYIARLHDLNGMIDLLRLQLSLQSVDSQEMKNAIDLSPFTNPYTGKPMTFNPLDNSIEFECLDSSALCRVAL